MIEFETEDPLVKETHKHGLISRDEILDAFLNHDWEDMNGKLETGDSNQFFHSPSIYFKDKENQIEICFSLLGKSDDFEFLAFFVREKEVKGFLGFGSKVEKVVSDLPDFNTGRCKAVIRDFVNLDLDALEKTFGG